MRRRTVLTAPIASVALAVAGCDRTPAAPRLWRNGLLSVATGNTTGVFYQIGGGYADVITRHVAGYQASAEPTGASGDNISRIARGDAEIALVQSDVAADAVKGQGVFDGPQPVRALAQIYPSYITVTVRADSGIRTLEQMRGKRVSTGTPKSGTELVALRVLEAVGLDPGRDVVRRPLSLTRSVRDMVDGNLDAIIWTGGLPTGGLSDLVDQLKGGVFFPPMGDVITSLQQRYGPVYQPATVPKATYRTPADVPAGIVGNMLVVPPDMPAGLATDLTRVLFQYQAELAAVHPEGGHFDRDMGRRTDPVPLHPGAQRYFGSGRGS